MRLFSFMLASLLAAAPVHAQFLIGLARQDDDFKALAKDSLRHFTLLPQIKSLNFDQVDNATPVSEVK